jgi:hypothetical protein
VDFESAAVDLAEMAKAGVVLLRTSSPIVDFTKLFQGTLDVYGEKKILSIDLGVESDLPTIVYLLTTIFDENVLVLGWDIKQIITYFKFQLKHAQIHFTAKVMDLRLLEAFSGIKQEPPQSLKQALKRMAAIKDNSKAKVVHAKIHRPLFLEIIPSIETQGLLNTDLKKRVYPYYEIEGSVNGRLQGSKAFPLAINPHGLTDPEKEKLRLRSEDELFLYFDFNSMEVSMLQYLSGDKKLAEVLKDGDCYKNMWSLLFKSACEKPEQRQFIKTCFLPVVFGMGPSLLMEKTGCSENAAVALSQGLKHRFKDAFDYVESFQGSSTAEDYFGRRRSFEDTKPHTARNFVIQAPSAVICMEKLIDLYNIIGDKLLLSIHDGYVIRCNPKFDKPLIVKCKKALEAPSQLAPGLQLSVNCELGARLHKMKALKM